MVRLIDVNTTSVALMILIKPQYNKSIVVSTSQPIVKD